MRLNLICVITNCICMFISVKPETTSRLGSPTRRTAQRCTVVPHCTYTHLLVAVLRKYDGSSLTRPPHHAAERAAELAPRPASPIYRTLRNAALLHRTALTLTPMLQCCDSTMALLSTSHRTTPRQQQSRHPVHPLAKLCVTLHCCIALHLQ